MSQTRPDALVRTVNPNSEVQAPASQLWAAARTSNSSKALDSRIVFPSSPTEPLNVLVSLGKDAHAKGQDANARREILRKAYGTGVKKVKELATSADVKRIHVEASEGDEAVAAVGSHLSLHEFSLKTKKDASSWKDISLYPTPGMNTNEWEKGVVAAQCQILARDLMEIPGNLMTPTIFCERIKEEFKGIPNVEIFVRDEEWAKQKNMNTFLSVAKGTDEPAKFLEIHYKGAKSSKPPLAFVGKGITFDSGGISLKPSAGMKLMRGDMGGAAAVCSAALGIAKMQLPVDLIVVTPLTENLPGPSASKPGDIVYAMNGKSVEIDNTDAEGRLVLSDALYYVSTVYKPRTLIDVATLTGAMDIALGEVYSGVFSTSDSLWTELHQAGEYEYDRFWRMPLDEDYGPQIYSSNADLCNTGGKPAGSCTAALFLKAFVEGIESEDGKEPELRWAHIDIAGTMEATRPSPYQMKGMTGRPVRALIEFTHRSVSSST